MINRLVYAFPVWVTAARLLALWHPEVFTWFSGPFISCGLAMIMLGMGLTLSTKDFSEVFRQPKKTITGITLQYTIMPALGWSIANLYQLPTPSAISSLFHSVIASALAGIWRKKSPVL